MLELLLASIGSGGPEGNYAPDVVYFLGGASGGGLASIERYDIISSINNISTAVLSVARHSAASAGNVELGITTTGVTIGRTSTTEVLSYDAESISIGTSLPTAVQWAAATGNAVLCIVAGGENIQDNVTNAASSYEYNTHAVAATTTLSVARQLLAAAANSEYALFAGGWASPFTVDKYNLINLTRANATALLTNRSYASAASTTELALFMTGYPVIATTEKYLFTTETRSAGAALKQARYVTAGSGNVATAVISGGSAGGTELSTKTIQEYLYASDATSVSPAVLVTGRQGHTALCTTPGGF